jgi:hypothetical protein
MPNTHWHIATGLAGYGPDGSDGYGTADSPASLAAALTDELARHASAEWETADVYGDDGQYEQAWRTLTRARGLETLAHNFDPKRANSPLYRHDPAAWESTVEDMTRKTFPLDVSHNTRLYVWECELDSAVCEHAKEES